jgi:hypothetical protein
MTPFVHIAVILAALALIGLGAYGLAPTLFRARLGRLQRGSVQDDWAEEDDWAEADDLGDDLGPGSVIDPSLLPQGRRVAASFLMPRAWAPGPGPTVLSSVASSTGATADWAASAGPGRAETDNASEDAEDGPENEEADEVLDIFREVLPVRSPGEERRVTLFQAEQGRVSITELLADARLTARAVLERPSGALQR